MHTCHYVSENVDDSAGGIIISFNYIIVIVIHDRWTNTNIRNFIMKCRVDKFGVVED